MPSLNQVKAVVVRACLCLHFVLVVWRVTESWSQRFWLMACSIAPFLIEGVYTVVKRNGIEWKLFSLCFFFYLGATLPGIWLLEIHKTNTYQNQNYTQVDGISISGLEIPVRLSPNTWVLVVEEMMLYLMILGRWMLPRGGVGREQLTQLLFGFVGIASDIMELFSLFDEASEIRHNPFLTYVILGVWSLSVLQFTLTFATAHRPRRARGLRLAPDHAHDLDQRHRRSVLRVELLATVLSLFMQDGPFLAVRLYTIVQYDVITYSLVFFTSKNVLVILLLVYKIFLLLSKMCCPKRHDHHHDDDDDDDDYEGLEDVVGKLGRRNYGYDHRYEEFGMKSSPSRNQHPKSLPAKSPQSQNSPSRRLPSESLPSKGRGNGQLPIPDQGDLRQRKEVGVDISREPSDTDVNIVEPMPDLQKVIDGPGTPAKSMERMNKYYQFYTPADKEKTEKAAADEKKDKAEEDATTPAEDANVVKIDSHELTPSHQENNGIASESNDQIVPRIQSTDISLELDKVPDLSGRPVTTHHSPEHRPIRYSENAGPQRVSEASSQRPSETRPSGPSPATTPRPVPGAFHAQIEDSGKRMHVVRAADASGVPGDGKGAALEATSVEYKTQSTDSNTASRSDIYVSTVDIKL